MSIVFGSGEMLISEFNKQQMQTIEKELLQSYCLYVHGIS